jgi:PAS domain S-box-containing protein
MRIVTITFLGYLAGCWFMLFQGSQIWRDPGLSSSERAVSELILCGLAGMAFAGLLWHYHRQHLHQLTGEQRSRWIRREVALAGGLLVVIAVGWLATEMTSLHEDTTMRHQVLVRAELAAASFEPEFVRQLHWDATDLTNPAYVHLKRLLRSFPRANEDLRFAELMGLRDGRTYFLADSEPPNSPDYSPPGQFYAEAERSYLDAIATHQSFVLGPITDHWGVWITGSVPVANLEPGMGWVTFDLDLSAAGWDARIRLARLPVVLITLLISVLGITFHRAQERIQETLRQVAGSEQRNSSLVEGSPNCVQMCDAAGRPLLVNQNGLKALGLPMEAVYHHPFIELWPAAVRPVVADAIQRTLLGEPVKFEADYVRPDGRVLTWSSATNPIRDEHGRVRSFVVILSDITARKQAERELLAAKEAAETATRAKSEFLAVMSHEIRTPISGVIGLLDLLQKQPQPPKQRYYTGLARDNAEHLLEILDEILDAAKIESGRLSIETIPFRLRAELHRVLEAQRVRAEAKGLELAWTVDSNVPAVLVGDPTRLRQMVANLVGNAIKFTPKGGVYLTVRRDPAPDGARASIRVSVRDTGIGIPPEVHDRLFKEFAQVDASTTRQYGGTGLGLAIVKNLAERMDGSISLESAPNAGSTFTFIVRLAVGSEQALPAGEPDAAPLAPAPRPTARLRLLAAEDDPTNREVLQYLVAQLGHEIEFAENGRQAVDRLCAARFDAVLMDNRMAVMDGFQATRLVREPTSGVLDHEVHIIAITANASHTYRDECLAAGMNDYLTKPVRESALRDALDRAIAFQRKRGIVLSAMPSSATDRRESAPGMTAAELAAVLEAPAEPPDPATQFSAETLRKITAQYLERTPQILAEMRTALGAGDLVTLSRNAHSLKSSSWYVRGAEVTAVCAELETRADAGGLAGLSAMVEEAEQSFARLRPRLEASIEIPT